MLDQFSSQLASRGGRCWLWLAAVCGLSLLLPGCQGCTKTAPPAGQNKTADEGRTQKKPPKKKPDFEVARVRLQPSDSNLKQAAVKPGHWVATDLPIKANNFDFPGRLEAKTVDRTGAPLDVDNTRFHITISRPASLPKGQVKHFETLFYVPYRANRPEQTVWLATRVLASDSGHEVSGAQEPTMEIPNYQYFFVVLSTTPASYGFLDKLDTIRPSIDEYADEETLLYYRVVLPKIARRIPLPSNALTWSSIAYLLWDDIDPNLLTLDQQDAMIDWLHFGGQVVVSGPHSMDKLRGSFLEKYLPAEKTQSIELKQANFDGFNAYWKGVHDERQKQAAVVQKFEYEPLSVVSETPPLGVELKLAPGGRFFPETDLVCERQVGRGRIVLSAFALDDRRVRYWSGFDEFLNSWLLRRPTRQFQVGDFSGVRAKFGGEYRGKDKNPLVSTTLRFFTRDIGVSTASDAASDRQRAAETELYFDEAAAASGAGEPEILVNTGPNTSVTAAEFAQMKAAGLAATTVDQADVIFQDDEGADVDPNAPEASRQDPSEYDALFGGYRPATKGSSAGWNDRSGAADAARRSLREAAGISIPEASFVLRTLAIYLLVLVPVNWGFFRLIGRVEYAWAVAPLLAIGGAAAVIRFAQLDIGFARSQNEVAVIETFGDYQRAHLTRYTALYSSLSTGYELAFEDTTALAQPFPVDPNFARRQNEPASEVRFARDKRNSLRDFQVASNSTDMIHSEQMFNLGGPIALEGDEAKGYQVRNNSTLALQEVGVLRRMAAGVEGAWVGELKPKAFAVLAFAPLDEKKTLRFKKWDESKIAAALAKGEIDDSVRLNRFFDLATTRLKLREGDVRLVGHTVQALPGFVVAPAASQATQRTLVISHLKIGDLAPPAPDRLSKRDLIEKAPVLRDGAPAPPAESDEEIEREALEESPDDSGSPALDLGVGQ